jgi:hypothetical protein
MKRLSVCAWFLSIVCASAPPLSALLAPSLAQKTPPPDTLMLFAHQDDDPIRIVQASFSADNTLLDAQLENKSHQKIQSYRIGWVVVRKDDLKLAKSNAVDVPKDVDTTATFSVPGPENAAKDDLAKHPTGIVFYVAELQFQDGTHWQAEAKKIRKEATEMVK